MSKKLIAKPICEIIDKIDKKRLTSYKVYTPITDEHSYRPWIWLSDPDDGVSDQGFDPSSFYTEKEYNNLKFNKKVDSIINEDTD